TMNDPVLVASTDGIGTKVHIAAQTNRLSHLGFDIVNHSINDILVQGAKPLFFLDYLATDKLNAEKMATVVMGMAEAC
ncbi:AIR synthase related protein, partial [Acinetobacter baumannii]